MRPRMLTPSEMANLPLCKYHPLGSCDIEPGALTVDRCVMCRYSSVVEALRNECHAEAMLSLEILMKILFMNGLVKVPEKK